jgi:hypothetical protein
MSTTNPTSEIRATAQDIKAHLDQWESGINRLEDEVRQVSQEAQKEYFDQIAVLRQHLKELRLRWQAIEEGEPQEWRESHPAFQQRLTRFRQVFMQTANKLHREERVALGWLQGFTDERTHESAGWAEGMGEHPEGSAGWAEGMGHRPEGSKGWAEGYDEVNKN